MNIEKILKQLDEIDKMIDVLNVTGEIKNASIQSPRETIVPPEANSAHEMIVQSKAISPNGDIASLSPENGILSATSKTENNTSEQSVEPLHLNKDGSITRNEPAHDDIYYTISLFDMITPKK